MSALSPVLRSVEGNLLMFWCPGCDRAHAINYSPGRWTWDGNAERPTFSPSVLAQWQQGEAREERRCHSFVRAGQIEFLADCTHALVGKTVPLPAWPEP